MFGKKTKEEKIVEEMKKKKEQIDKLKEEMNNMAKLILKDGKLQKVEDTPKQEEVKPVVQVPPPIEIMQPSSHDIQYMRQQIEADNQRRAVEEQTRQYDEAVARAVQQQQQQQVMYRQPVPPPQMPQMYQPQQPTVVKVTIEVITGGVYAIDIESSVIKQFISELDKAINSQIVFAIGNRVINGKQIVSYSFE